MLDQKANILTDGKVLIRPCLYSDLDELYLCIQESFSELRQKMAWCHANFCKDDLANWLYLRQPEWRDGKEYTFVICDPLQNSIAGTISLNHLDRINMYANLGYWVKTNCTKRGFASGAARLIAKFGFEQLLLHRIEIIVAEGNIASAKVAQKSGAQREGLLRRRLLLNGQSLDASVFSLIKDDLRSP